MDLVVDLLVAHKFRLVRELGRGGMGSVWLAQHQELDIPCAVKFIEGEAVNQPEMRERFTREAKAAAQLRSPHVVQILDQGVWENIPYIAMELLDGEDLGQRIHRLGRIEPADCVAILTQVARALAKAHAVPIIHRDLKPDNVFIVRDDDRELVKILDFGIAKMNQNVLGASNHTRTGTLMGTPYYMSPEQAQGTKKVDHRSDVWALAIIAFECLTGHRPYDSEALGDLLIRICVGEPPTVASFVTDLPPEVDVWWARATKKDPEERFQSAKELIDALSSALGVVGPASAVGQPSRFASHADLGVAEAASARTKVPAATTGGRTVSPITAASVSSVSPPKTSSKGLVIGIAGVSLAVGALAVVFFATRGHPPEAKRDTQVASIAPPNASSDAPVVATVAPSTNAAAATPPASATASSTATDDKSPPPTTVADGHKPAASRPDPKHPALTAAPPPATPTAAKTTVTSKPKDETGFLLPGVLSWLARGPGSRMDIMHRRFLFPTLLTLSLYSAALSAQTSPDADKAQARSLVQDGLAALRASDFATAFKAFTAADRLYHAPTTLLGVARSNAGLGKLVAAEEAYNRLVREPLPPSPPEAFVNAVEDGRKELAAITPRIPFVIINVTGPSDPHMTIDGEPLSSGALGLKRPVDPGKHVIAATAAGYAPAKQEVTTVEGVKTPVAVTLVLKQVAATAPTAASSASAASSGAPSTPHDDASDGGGNARTTGAYVAFGVGGAGLVVGAIGGILALGKKSSLESACTDGHCPASASSTHDSYKTMGLVSTIGFVAAIAGGGVGLTLLLTAPKDTSSAFVRPMIGWNTVGVGGEF